MDKKCLTAKQLKMCLQIGRTVLNDVIRENPDIPRFKVGGSWRYDLDEVIDHLKKREKTKGDGSAGPR